MEREGRRKKGEKKGERGGKRRRLSEGSLFPEHRVIQGYNVQQIKRSFSKNFDKKISLGI